MEHRYRAEVIGSLLRPQYLKDARKQWEAKQLGTREFKRSEDRAVDEMIALQEQCGVDVITDGEMRRTHFIAPLTDVITGVQSIPAFTRVGGPHEQGEGAGDRIRFACTKDSPQAVTHRRRISYARGRAKAAQGHTAKPLMMTLRWSPEFRATPIRTRLTSLPMPPSSDKKHKARHTLRPRAAAAGLR
jgi:5-methyltetrahydropteroyltriglutamate--homocysteine methyltransferase